MTEEQKGKQEKTSLGMTEKVVVAVKASKEIPKTALVWALTHVVQPGDCITLLVVPSHGSGRKWGFPRFSGDCSSSSRKSQSGSSSEQKSGISDSCSQMILQLHDVYDPNKINVKIKIVSGSPCGAVAVEAKRAQAGWVVLDKQLKHEEKRCMEELQCNIVIMKGSQAKVLRLNLVRSPEKEAEASCQLNPDMQETSVKHSDNKNGSSDSSRGIEAVVTPTSSPELGTPFSATEAGTSSVSSSDPGTSPFCTSERNADLKKGESIVIKENQDLDESSSEAESENLSLSSVSLRYQPWITEYLTSQHQSSQRLEEPSTRAYVRAQGSTSKALLEKFSKLDREAGIGMSSFKSDIGFSGNEGFASRIEGGWHHQEPLEWSARQKIAVGAARGLRYLHEECRVGCIVHRDMRPNNILITHDFEPLVGDFGLARWQPDGDTGVETRVIGAFGYLAPEYAQSGQVTEKADIYSFGVVLVELVTGRKAVDLNRPKGQQCLTEWARPLLEEYAIDELVDPRLEDCYSEHEVYCMLHAASLCIRQDPHSRPRMSQVLRILEGDMLMDSNYSLPRYDIGNRSGRVCADQKYYSGSLENEALEEFNGKLYLDGLRSGTRRTSCADHL
ncbi:hypothetical protein GOBAR_DD10811 [Gossypium barbadense]|nr:hypothetical protein GOBAR_DD10811 [Gossypium barbadense]